MERRLFGTVHAWTPFVVRTFHFLAFALKTLGIWSEEAKFIEFVWEPFYIMTQRNQESWELGPTILAVILIKMIKLGFCQYILGTIND